MNYTFELTQQEVQVIAGALVALPYGQVAALITKLQQSVAAQESAATPVAVAAPETAGDSV